MAKFFTENEKKVICDYMNPEGHNHKSVNFFRYLDENEICYTLEVGYRITYLNCSPKYEKTTISIPKDLFCTIAKK